MEYWLYSVIYHSNIMKWVFSSPSYKHRDRGGRVSFDVIVVSERTRVCCFLS